MAPYIFLDIKPNPVKDAEAVILPIPYEATTTYISGTYKGPEAILAASAHIEPWDEEHDWDPSAAVRITTAEPIEPVVSGPQAMIDKIRKVVQPWISQGKLILALGGEHTITLPLIQAALTKHPDLTVVALDAHADLREKYDGSPLSHACTMRRIHELGRPLTILGVRNYSDIEYQFLRVAPRLTIFPAKQLHSPEGWQQAIDHLRGITGPVYLTMDMDVLDPGIMPGVGNPEPGGLTYYQTLAIMEIIAQRGPVIGLDLVELAPIPGNRVSEFTAARLAYKALGYIYIARRREK